MTPLQEEDIKSAFVQAINIIISQKHEIIVALDNMIQRPYDMTVLYKEQ